MNWLRKLRVILGHDEETFVNNQSDHSVEEAYKSAQKALEEAHSRHGEAQEIRKQLSVLNFRNHYGESIMLAMMPKERL